MALLVNVDLCEYIDASHHTSIQEMAGTSKTMQLFVHLLQGRWKGHALWVCTPTAEYKDGRTKILLHLNAFDGHSNESAQESNFDFVRKYCKQVDSFQQMNVGTYGCVIEEGPFVRKFFVTRQSLSSFQSETRPDLLDMLRTIDPEQKRFLQATEITQNTVLSSEIREECIRRMSWDLSPGDILDNVPSFLMPKAQEKEGPITRGQQEFLKESLRMLHAHNWTHNDIHIKNIMMGSDFMPRIVDFGLATPLRSESPADVQEFAAETVLDRNMLQKAFERSLEPPRKRKRSY